MHGRHNGRPGNSWKDQVERDIQEMKVDQWKRKITDRKNEQK